jgi:hypothetical protein
MLKIYTEYSTNFAKGWQRFLECLNAINNLSTYLKVWRVVFSLLFHNSIQSVV